MLVLLVIIWEHQSFTSVNVAVAGENHKIQPRGKVVHFLPLKNLSSGKKKKGLSMAKRMLSLVKIISSCLLWIFHKKEKCLCFVCLFFAYFWKCALLNYLFVCFQAESHFSSSIYFDDNSELFYLGLTKDDSCRSHLWNGLTNKWIMFSAYTEPLKIENKTPALFSRCFLTRKVCWSPNHSSCQLFPASNKQQNSISTYCCKTSQI